MTFLESGYPWDIVIFSDVSLINEIYPEVPGDYAGLRSFISSLSSPGFQDMYLKFGGKNQQQTYLDEKILGAGLDE